MGRIMNFCILMLLFVCVLLLMIFIIGMGNCSVWLEFVIVWYSGRLVEVVVVWVVVSDIVSSELVFSWDLLVVLFNLIRYWFIFVWLVVCMLFNVCVILVLILVIVLWMFLLKYCFWFLLWSLMVFCVLMDVLDGMVV